MNVEETSEALILRVAEQLRTRSLMLCGGESALRESVVGAIAAEFRANGWRVFTLAEHCKSYDRVLDSALRELPITALLDQQSTKSLSRDQSADRLLEWVFQEKKVLLILPELSKLAVNAPLDFWTLISQLLTTTIQLEEQRRSTTTFRALLTTKNEPSAAREALTVYTTHQRSSAAEAFSHYFHRIALPDPSSR